MDIPEIQNGGGVSTVNESALILQQLMLMNNKIDQMRSDFDKRFDAIEKKCTEQISNFKAEIDADLGGMNAQLINLKQHIEDKEKFDPEKTLVVTGFKVEHGETQLSLHRNIEAMISIMGPNVCGTVVDVKRLTSRNTKPGIVKVELRSLEQKLSVLRGKTSLKRHSKYENVWIRSSMQHGERVGNINFRTLLNIVPGGENYYLASNGRIVSKDQGAENNRKTMKRQRVSSSGRGNVIVDMGDDNVPYAATPNNYTPQHPDVHGYGASPFLQTTQLQPMAISQAIPPDFQQRTSPQDVRYQADLIGPGNAELN